jgi:hypothetical protein
LIHVLVALHCAALNESRRAEDGKSDVFNRYGGAFKKAIADVNPACVEKALDALLIFVDRANCALNYADSILPALASKGLSAAKTAVKEKAMQAVLMYIEIGATDQALAALSEASADKLAKVAEPALDALVKALQDFGPRNVPISKVRLTQRNSQLNGGICAVALRCV